MSLKLYTDEKNTAAYPALIAAKYNGVDIAVPAFKLGTDDKKPEFTKSNPRGKVPALETAGGFILESAAIARYVARLNPSSTLLGGNPFEQAQIDQWVESVVRDFEIPASALVYPIQGKAVSAPETTAHAFTDVKAFLASLNKHLETRTYLVGESVTLADIVVFSTMLNAVALAVDRKARQPFGNVWRWFTTIANQPNVRAVVGDVEMCEVAQTAKAAPAAKPKEAPKPKEAAKPKEAPKPKEEPKPKPADDEAGDEEEDEKPRKKNPLDALPKSALDLEWWKRTYSNTPDTAAAMKEFWAVYDKEGYCIYFCDYLYNDECRVAFMTSNMIRGFLQRLETLHKYAFGTMLVMNKEAPFKVAGCWLFRGTDIPADMQACDDFAYYTWTRANTDDEATRDRIRQFWSGDVAGETVDEDWKVFK